MVIASGFGVLRNMLDDYKKIHPECEVELKFCDTDRIHAMLASGDADAGLNLGEILDSRLTNRDLMEGRYYIAAVSYTHLDVYKRQITGVMANRFR